MKSRQSLLKWSMDLQYPAYDQTAETLLVGLPLQTLSLSRSVSLTIVKWPTPRGEVLVIG